MADREMTLRTPGLRLHELAARLGVTGFWSWWTAQIDPLVPAMPRAALARRRMRPVLSFEADSATLWRPAMEQGIAVMKQAAVITLAGDAAAVNASGRAALTPLTPMVYGGSAAASRLVIAVPMREVLRKTIVLPAALEENLRQALAYDLDRHTPFKEEELYFDAVVTRRDAALGVIHVDLTAVRRGVVDGALKHASAWGAEVAAVVPATVDLSLPSRVNLLPLSMRLSRPLWRRWQFWVPMAAIALLALAAVLIPLWQKRDYAIMLNSLADQARSQAAVSETLRQELDAKVADHNTALERKFAYPGALQTVDYVSKLLPDDTWLTQLELKSVAKGKEVQRELLVRGETGNAGRLVQLFEDSQHFAQAAPRAPTTKIQPGPGEIFDLGALLKPRVAPDRVPLIVRDAAPESAPPSAGGSAPVAARGAGAASEPAAAVAPVTTTSSGTPATSTVSAPSTTPAPSAKTAPSTAPSPSATTAPSAASGTPATKSSIATNPAALSAPMAPAGTPATPAGAATSGTGATAPAGAMPNDGRPDRPAGSRP